ncbi:MAG TPA: outer membrane protein transport protein [Gammaproteobacteria bacterium]
MGATIRTLSAWRTAVAAALALLAAESRAAGFLVVEQGVHEVGRAVSGASAAADSPGTLFFNPAGITYLDGTQAAAALHVIVPQAEFSGESSRNPQLGGTTIETGNGEDGGAVGLVPNLYYVRDLTRRLKFGLGINAPFGLVTEYDDGWAGRYHAIRSDLLTLNLNPTLALGTTACATRSAWSTGRSGSGPGVPAWPTTRPRSRVP